jgi:integrase
MRKGKWEAVPGDGWQAALDKYNEEAADLHADRKPRSKGATLTVADLCSAYLTAKLDLLKSGELAPRTFADYKGVADRLVAFFGKRRRAEDLDADDFGQLRADIAKRSGPVRLAGQILQTKMIFKFGYENGLLDRPVRYGQAFKRPGASVIRKARNGNGPKMFEAEELRLLIDSAEPQLKAMVLLAANCGYGNNDVGRLPVKSLNLETGWANFPRPKTGIARRCPLWPETVAAIREWLTRRPKPKDPANDGLLFITKRRLPWTKATSANPVSAEFRKLMEAVDAERAKAAKKKRQKAPEPIHRSGVSFYAIRHTFQTVGDSVKDPVATSAIMGHSDSSMAAVYREKVDDYRLRAVVDHVHDWLFPKSKT